MKQVLAKFPDDLAKELEKYPNMSETLREAFRIYNGHISTDTLAGMRTAFEKTWKAQKEMQDRFIEQYDMVEKMHSYIEEMRNR